MSLGRILSIIGLLLALASTAVGVGMFFSTRARDERFAAAQPCTPEQVSRVDFHSCWVELRSTVKEKSDHRVVVETRWNNRPLIAEVTLDEDAAAKLQVGDTVTARFTDREVMRLRAGGVEVTPADSFARTATDQLVSIAIFVLASLLLGWHVFTHRRRRAAPGRVDGFGVVLVVLGGSTLVGLPFMLASREGEARAYAEAPVCAGPEEATCRFTASGKLATYECHRTRASSRERCDVTFAIEGAPVPERRGAMIEREPLEQLKAAGGTARLELYDGQITQLEAGGRRFPLMGLPSQAAATLPAAIAAAAVILLLGIYRLVRTWRRS